MQKVQIKFGANKEENRRINLKMASDAISLQVTVDGPSTGQYLRGPEVTGNVAIRVHEAVMYHSIELVLICQSTVDMRDRGRSGTIHRSTTDFVPEEKMSRLVHLFEKIVLKRCDTDIPEELAPGTYNFRFIFPVSKNDLPSTFTTPGQATSGVAYYVECLVLPEKDATQAIARKFTYFPFIGTVDIGSDEYLLPIKREQKWHGIGGILCFGSRAISLAVELDRSGYCVGEAVRVNATVTNGTSEDVQIRAALERTVYSDVRTPRHRHRVRWDPEAITRENGGTIGPRSTVTEGFDIVIPESCPVTMSMYAEILHLQYDLVVRVCSCYRMDTSLRIPITIGCRNSRRDF